MIDLPIGKALIAIPGPVQCKYECMEEDYVCNRDCCAGCDVKNREEDDDEIFCCDDLACNSSSRKDGISVIHKVVDYSA